MKRRQTIAIVSIGLSCILFGLVFGYLNGFRYGLNLNKGRASEVPSSESPLENPSNPSLDLRLAEIVKELNCVCGCKMELSPCTCDERSGSKEIRKYVRTLVELGLSRSEMVKRLTEKYGEGILIKRIS